MTSTDTRAPAVLIPTGSEAEWLEARRKGITASEIAVVMGLSPYSSPYALYHQKLGVLPPQDETDAMALGKHMESYVAQRFAEKHPEFIVDGDGRTLYAHPDRPWQMATPDRLIQESATCGITERDGVFEVENLAVLETKIDGGSDEWGDDGTDQVPVHYRAQVLWQMDVLGVTTGYVACLLWSRRQVRVYELTMDAAGIADLQMMVWEAEAFLRRLRDGDPPDVDWRPATTGALKTLNPDPEKRDAAIPLRLAQWYQAACRNAETWEQRRDLYANRIRERLGGARYAVDLSRPATSPGHAGQVIARRDVYPVKEHVRKAHVVDRLVPVKPPAPKEQPK